jgi:DNA uptake protein ComE-like DNA-binding protein
MPEILQAVLIRDWGRTSRIGVRIPLLRCFMKKFLAIPVITVALGLGCSTQRASETTRTDQASAQTQASSQTTPPADDQQNQEKANSAGQKVGEKARQAEVQTRDDREKIKAGAADATQKIKKGAKVAADDIKAAAAGVRSGWSKSNELNVNTASQADLEQAGMTKAEAATVIKHRPYQSKDDLKPVLSQSAYEKIQDRVVVK